MDMVGGLAFFFIFLGIIGLFGSTVGSALLAWAVFRLAGRGKVKSFRQNFERSLKIDLLVVAHNEEALICQTLSSLAQARTRFLSEDWYTEGSQPEVRIRVGIDHCTDKTEELAQRWAEGNGVQVSFLKNPGALGKWNMLQQLITTSDADWVSLIDVGSVWEPTLLKTSLIHFYDPETVGIAPSYRPVQAGILEKLNWRLERFIKTIEAKAGGPVSVHGATVFYRRQPLLQAIDTLKQSSWLNDDVVIPLSLRIQFPESKIVYLTRPQGKAWVSDFGIRSSRGVEYGRRKRILLGNLQWIRTLYGKAVRSNATIGIITSRRVFRIFWAYWLLFVFVGTSLFALIVFDPSLISVLAAMALISVLAKFPFKGGLQRLRSAFWVGLEIPFHWLNTGNSSEKIWN